ncbi:hypothetical protein HMPREF9120_00378 [Neisseria sp. oral taxon 020 str. F0370]|nr:hypothetical protein HMPREF9120_00378 [Neisseria sp. oral taxon 020 str. F0370]
MKQSWYNLFPCFQTAFCARPKGRLKTFFRFKNTHKPTLK